MWTGELARKAGVNPETLRYYERRGILPTTDRTPAGYRNYPDWTVNLVRFIKRYQDLGYSLADIEHLLHLADSRAASCAEARAITAARIADLDRKITDLRRMRDCLADLGSICQGPGPGLLCRLM
ncbi:MAG: MerR family DNA-binding protein, partial [Catenulispora sp.]|nr:MerR family DNA-binding protein [Catenulispora sp.]